MFETGILALSGKYDPAGVLCLASIPVVILALIPFSKGVIAGSSANCIAFFIFVLWLASPENAVDGAFVNAVANNDVGYISNRSQTKWCRRDAQNIRDCMGTDGAMVFDSWQDKWGIKKNHTLVLSYDEIHAIKASGRSVEQDDYWVYDMVYPSANVSIAHGGDGIPQWLFHPACLVYITGFFALPTLGLGAIIKSKM